MSRRRRIRKQRQAETSAPELSKRDQATLERGRDALKEGKKPTKAQSLLLEQYGEA
jgi:hypothetical protein